MAARATKIDPAAKQHVDQAIGSFLTLIGDQICADAKALVQKKSGRLANSLVSEVNGKVLRVGSTDVDYSVYVEMGTMPHLIVPNSKKALSWPGARHPVAYVNHPGTRPYPYLRPALFKRREA